MSNSQPNVLVIYTDQQNRFAMGCMDNPDVETPNLDRIAQQGTLFRNAYSSTPVCSPFRVNLVTGRYGMETGCQGNGCHMPPWCHSLVDDFNDAGYRTSFVGKWHVGGNGNQPIPVEERAGFQEFVGYQCYNGFYKDVCFYDEDGTETRYEKHRTDVTTDIALDRLQREPGKPFFMVVGYQAPHYPEQPSPKYDHMYRGRPMTPRANYEGTDPYIPTFSPRSPRPFELCADFRRYGNDIQEYLRMYYGMVTQIDANVGRIMAQLEELGVADNTVVLFTSDHGDLAGSHGLNGKANSYEEAAGVPLLMRGPGVPSGLVVDAPIDSCSFVPTCADLAGVETPESSAARSRAALLRGEADERPIFADLKKWCMIRRGALKLTVEDDDCRPTKLFDVVADPYEQKNLVDSPEFVEIKAQLLAELTDWRAKSLRFREAGIASG